ncbi:sodium/glutamate symporter [Pseudoalteromonas sp. G4]|uniref:sodium/glutamate symporter n=1 Tax=Pseudoalteromonas sp. G4 TaxID=2992761 RepID=UPI00237D4936|nr:sodium/glutamate symporter [Pseudoalteromonas sp. G4]MDE3270724.1 sodium/glutamate symporter [Pseudoalteromonas sp. G4]
MVLDERTTLMTAIVVYFLGKWLNRRFKVLQQFNIPEAVTGGILAASISAFLYYLFSLEITFSLASRDLFLIVFFTTIGLNAKISSLVKGGQSLLLLLILAVMFLVVQNIIGVSVFSFFGMPAISGLLGGSISLSGGHGTAIAWSSEFHEQYAIYGALELALACATFGLIFGGILGGPIAKYLVERHKLKPTVRSAKPLAVGVSYRNAKFASVNIDQFLISIFIILAAIGLGHHLAVLLQHLNFELPLFVCCLFVGIILSNTVPYLFKIRSWPSDSASLSFISDLCLGLFLAMSLMSIQLWTLTSLALPFVVLLVFQVIATMLYATLVVFRVLGKDYDAAVMASGYAGLTLGATPTAIANMTAVTQHYAPSTKAFIVVPLVGAFFIDILNALVISQFVSWLG